MLAISSAPTPAKALDETWHSSAYERIFGSWSRASQAYIKENALGGNRQASTLLTYTRLS